MLFRQLLPVFVVLGVFFTVQLGGGDFLLRWIVAPSIALLIGGLAVALFVAFLTPPRR